MNGFDAPPLADAYKRRLTTKPWTRPPWKDDDIRALLKELDRAMERIARLEDRLYEATKESLDEF